MNKPIIGNTSKGSSKPLVTNKQTPMAKKTPHELELSYKQFDDIVIPTLNKNKPNPNPNAHTLHMKSSSQKDIKGNTISDYSDIDYYNNPEGLEDNTLPLLEELTKEQIQSHDLILNYIDEEDLQKLLSKNIHYKEEGIDSLIAVIPNMFNELPNMKDKDKCIDLKSLINTLLNTLMTLLEEKHPITITKTIDLLSSLLTLIKDNNERLSINLTLPDRLLILIRKLITDINIKVRKKAIDLYCYLLTLGNICCDYNNLINELLTNDIKYADINPLSSLQITSKLTIIERIISDFNTAFQKGITDLDLFPYTPIAKFLKINVSNNKIEIRKESRKLIKKFTRQFGLNKIALDLLEINPRDLSSLQDEIPELKTFIEAHFSNNGHSSGFNLSHDGENKSNGRTRSPKGQFEKCRHCNGILTVSNQQYYEKHKATNCPMFTQCYKCREVIEVKKLVSHCLIDCFNKKEFQQCKRCKEAILVSEYDQHKRANRCNPSKDMNVYNRCPLCHKDIPPSDKGYYTHLVVEGCLKQTKSNNQLKSIILPINSYIKCNINFSLP